jgi:Glycine zipper 2TM domain
MRKIMIIAALGLLLAGCQTARQDRQLGGALIGGGTGAVIGGLATRSTGGAVAGGVIGAVAGAIIADETRPRGRCYARTASGRRVRVAC